MKNKNNILEKFSKELNKGYKRIFWFTYTIIKYYLLKYNRKFLKRNSKKGLATLCIGGGMGVAMCIERK